MTTCVSGATSLLHCTEIWINATYFPVTDDAGVPVKVVKFATDITAQRRA